MDALLAQKNCGVQLAPSELDEIRVYLAPKATGVKKLGRTVAHAAGLGKTRTERFHDTLLRTHNLDRPASGGNLANAGDRIELRPVGPANNDAKAAAALYRRQSGQCDLNANEQAALCAAIAPQATGFKKFSRRLSHAIGRGPTPGERRDTMLLAAHGLQHSQTAPARIGTAPNERASSSQ